MKTIKYISSALLASGLLISANATSVTTDPVGYITLQINGTGGEGSSAFSFLSVPMHSAIDAQSTIASFGTSSITASSADWTVDEFAATHFVQIVSGPNEGIAATITANTSDTLTTAEDLSTLLAGGESFAIRKYTTIADVFGPENEAGLVGGANAGAADNILIPDGAGGFGFYYYKNAGLIGGTGWRSSASPSIDEANKILPFGEGFLVRRIASEDISLVVTGSVIVNDSIIPFESGINWAAPVAPKTYTIADFFGPNNEVGLVGGANAGAADNILLPDGSGGYLFFYFKNAGLIGGTGWRSSASPSIDEADRILAQPGSLFILNRSQGGPFNLIELNPVASN